MFSETNIRKAYGGIDYSVRIGAYNDIDPDVVIGDKSVVWAWCRIGASKIGKLCKIHNWVNIGNNCRVGNGCNIQEYSYLSDGVTLGNNVYVGVGVIFGDVKYPGGETAVKKPVIVGDNVILGNNVTIIGGVRIGDNAVIGAGSVVTENIPLDQVWFGVPARHIRTRDEYDEKQRIEAKSVE